MMIDWWNVITHSFWIAGLSLSLAVFSYADWRAARRDAGLRDAIRDSLHSPAFLVGPALGCLGAGLSVGRWWERLAWLALACAFATLAGLAYTHQRREPSP